MGFPHNYLSDIKKQLDIFCSPGAWMRMVDTPTYQGALFALQQQEDLNIHPGGMTAKKYMAITKTSKATATRDLQDIVAKEVFTTIGAGRGVRNGLYTNTYQIFVRIKFFIIGLGLSFLLLAITWRSYFLGSVHF
ncbi:hypothetical protein [Galbibacter sp. PAP.153]|uniref:hypothetical protein n=1 Tax=Galbibacter sp. PAP.153 TaxID=3104623 RepID=UPI00300889CC